MILTEKENQCSFSCTPHSIKLSVRIPSPHTLISVTMCDRSRCYKPMPEDIFKVLTVVNILIMVYLIWLFRYQHFRGTCCPHLQDGEIQKMNGGSSSSNMLVQVYQTTCHITEDPDPYADCLIEHFPNKLCLGNLTPLFFFGGGWTDR